MKISGWLVCYTITIPMRPLLVRAVRSVRYQKCSNDDDVRCSKVFPVAYRVPDRGSSRTSIGDLQALMCTEAQHTPLHFFCLFFFFLFPPHFLVPFFFLLPHVIVPWFSMHCYVIMLHLATTRSGTMHRGSKTRPSFEFTDSSILPFCFRNNLA